MDKTRDVISITIISAFMLVCGTLALAPVLGGYSPAEYADSMEVLKSYGSLFSGIVGIILGRYFKS